MDAYNDENDCIRTKLVYDGKLQHSKTAPLNEITVNVISHLLVSESIICFI
jgi:hypothetical protein